MTLVLVGRVGRAHGLKGEVALEESALTALELHAVKSFVRRGRRGETRPLTLETARPAHTRMLVRFAGYGDRDQAATLTLGALLAERDALPDPGPGVAYTFQLIGLDVRTTDGRALGVLEEIIETGAHPVYVVRGTRELLIPATREVVRAVDLAGRVVTVELPAGLEDL